MTNKQEWIDYAKALKKYAQELLTWAKQLPNGGTAQDAGPGSNPPPPPPPPPGG